MRSRRPRAAVLLSTGGLLVLAANLPGLFAVRVDTLTVAELRP